MKPSTKALLANSTRRPTLTLNKASPPRPSPPPPADPPAPPKAAAIDVEALFRDVEVLDWRPSTKEPRGTFLGHAAIRVRPLDLTIHEISVAAASGGAGGLPRVKLPNRPKLDAHGQRVPASDREGAFVYYACVSMDPAVAKAFLAAAAEALAAKHPELAGGPA
ncbi:MAG: hypothetical protein ACJ8AI_10605 [Rhodopila sp.]